MSHTIWIGAKAVGVSKSFAELGQKLERAAREIETKSDKVIVQKQALAATTAVRKRISQAAPGGTLRAGGRKKDGGRSARVGARFDSLKGDDAGAIVRAQGPVHLIERDTAAHWIPRQLGGTVTHTASGRRRSKASVVRRKASVNKRLVIGGNVVQGPIRHPGTKGKHPFQRGVKDFMPSAGKLLEQGAHALVNGVMG